MLLLYAAVLLVLAGGIQSTPVPEKFSFLVTTKVEVLCVYVGFSVSINCKTNDPRASVSLSTPKSLSPSGLPNLKKRLTRKGEIFTINNAILHDGGHYYCKAERNGQIIKREVILLVSGIPEVDIIPYMNKRVVRGSEFNYTCRANQTLSCGFSLRWSKVGGPMTGVQITYSNKPSVLETHLKIKKADSSHSGYYTCKLFYNRSPVAKSYHEVQVKVVDRQKVKIASLSSSSIWVDNIGQEVLIICYATGFPIPTITWRKDGELLENCRKCDKRYVVTSYGLKIVQSRYPDDIGNFSCEARNDKESVIKYFQVYIPVAPVINGDDTVFTWRNKNEAFALVPCKLTQGATPRVQFSWEWKSGVYTLPVTLLNKVEVITYENRTESVLKIELPVSNIMSFVCTAKSSKGSDSVEFTLLRV